MLVMKRLVDSGFVSLTDNPDDRRGHYGTLVNAGSPVAITGIDNPYSIHMVMALVASVKLPHPPLHSG